MAIDIMPERIKEKARPCPFCGGKDLRLTPQEDFEKAQSESNENRACISISCHQCFLDLFEHTFDVHDYDKRLEMLLVKWNNRKEISDESEEN